ncbi:hypothetical protein E4T49_05919 [Aureobasidium sp. EXF-10728]|nr:hypothetical protein E4T49_05919 [Aureobasidium sp. EXF-10728]
MNEHQDEKVSPLTTILNFRDVSKFVKSLKPGLLYRSAHIDDASREDLDTLREQYGIRSVIDLRGMQPWPMISTVGLPGKTDFDYAQQYPDHIASTSILGLQLHYIGLAGPQFGQHVASQIGFWSKAKAFAEIAYSPASGTEKWKKHINAKLSKNRMTVPEIIIDHSYPQIKAIFKVLIDPSSYPVLILNKYGSELVSLIVCLVMFLLNADKESMHRDYMQTYKELANFKQERLEDNRALGVFNDTFVEPFLPFVNCLDQHIQSKHGGIEMYLQHIGLTQDEIQALKDTLCSGSKLSGNQECLINI